MGGGLWGGSGGVAPICDHTYTHMGSVCLDMSGYVWICLDMSGYVCTNICEHMRTYLDMFIHMKYMKVKS